MKAATGSVDVNHRLKVRFPLKPEESKLSAYELLWATNIGRGQFRLENSPVFKFGVSYQDVVLATPIDGQLEFVEVAIRGGHSTYRIITSVGREDDASNQLTALIREGCTYESGPGRFVTIDVPPKANIFDVYKVLQAGQELGAWDFEEGHCGHAVA